MEKSRQQYAREARSVKKTIDSGKLKGKSLASAKNKFHYLDRRAKGIVYVRPKKVSSSTKRRTKKHVVSKDQGFLPMFLAQMDMVRIEELVTDRIFKSIVDGNTTGITPVTDIVLDEVKNAVKKTVKASVENLASKPTFASDRKKRKSA